ncbi:MAG TPA: DUF2127 domain-containing protein [Opitutaceae bacterium]|nr:DUF2127 domain-containing protein [Opitutaceae bacterium]HWA10281.1 DUF2127 domain-containing protein [Opitutaceae bacterium]
MAPNKGLRLIAVLEGVKGLMGLLLAVGAAILSQRDLEDVARATVEALRLDPAAHYTSRFIQEASLINAKDMWWVALGALAYSAFRFGEGYGLWRERTWAEWLAVVSGSMYIPLEIVSLTRKPSWLKVIVLLVNLLIVLYVARALARGSRSPAPADAAGPKNGPEPA